RHIMDEFEERALQEYGEENLNGELIKHQAMQLLRDQIHAMRDGGNRTPYQAGIDFAEGGSLLVYYGDVQDFLKLVTDWHEGDPEYDDEKSWKLYCHLVAREMAKLYERARV